LSLAQRVRRLRRDLTPPEDEPRPVVLLHGNPEIGRLLWLGELPPGTMASEREAMVGSEVFAAADGETTNAFYHRMVSVARQRGVCLVSIGYASACEAPSNLDGSRRALN
jgi:hypothetical protein